MNKTTKHEMDVRSVRVAFNKEDLTPLSPLTDMDYVGQYLNGRVEAKLPFEERPLTIASFVDSLSGMETKEARRFLQEALQNDRRNVCSRGYHIRDVNQRGWTTLTSLLKFASTRPSLFPSVEERRWVLDPSKLPSVPRRGKAAKTCGCMTGRECEANPSCEFLRGGRLCVPRRERVGFEGVGDRPGQIEPLHRRNAVLAERGRLSYARGRDRYFRRPTKRTRSGRSPSFRLRSRRGRRSR